MIDKIEEKIFEANRTSIHKIYYASVKDKVYLNIESTKIIYVLSNYIKIRAFGLIRDLKKGDMYVIKNKDFYSMESTIESDVIVLEIYNEFILENFSIDLADICRGLILESIEKDNIILGMSLLLKYKIEIKHVNSEVWKVLSNIYSNIEESPKVCDDINDRDNMSNTKNIIYTILDDLPGMIKSDDDVTLDNISKYYGVSYYYLSKKFKEVVKINFNQYVLNLKINFLFDKLINTNGKITDIGMESGFKSISTLNRLFSSVYGISPREVRDIRNDLNFKIFLENKNIFDFVNISNGSENIYINNEIIIDLTRNKSIETMEVEEVKKRVIRVKNTINSFNNDKIVIILNMNDYYNVYNIEDKELKIFIVKTIKEILEIAMNKKIEITIIQKV